MKKNKTISFIGLSFLFSLCLSSCGQEEIKTTSNQEEIPTTSAQEEEIQAPNDNNRVFYEIFTSSYSDSNGDKIGDLKGITNRLDYLNNGHQTKGDSLGIQGIWLTPIFSSPSYHKYDANDYYKIDNSFGKDEDLKELIEECHKRGIKLILDLAINHTSQYAAWFTKFSAAHKNKDTTSPWYDWYTWLPANEVNTLGEGRTFKAISGSQDYYECNFDSSMPELNYDNEEVRKEMLNVAKYWIDFGVDGFRFDAAMYIYFNDNEKSAEFWNWYCSELRKYKEDIYTVAEVWATDTVTKQYYPYVNCFNFQVAKATGYIANAARGKTLSTYTHYIDSYFKAIQTLNSNSMLCLFQSNHDTDRTSGWLIDPNQYKMAANLYILTQGSPFIYYGEEIKMAGSRASDSNTDANRRLAMLWGDGDTVKDPTGATWTITGGKQNGTVQEQAEDQNSILNYYRKLIAFRNKYPQIGRGTYEQLKISKSKIGGFTITYNETKNALIHNNQNEAITLSLSSLGDFTTIIDSIGINSASLDGDELTIGAYTSVLLK